MKHTDFGKDLKECCDFFDKTYKHIEDNLGHIRKEKDVEKLMFLLHSLSLYKELYYLLEHNQTLSVPIVLRSTLECFLKLNDIHCNGEDGINRIRVSDLKEKIRLHSAIREVDPEYDKDNSQKDEIERSIDELKSRINSKDKEFRLTKQAVSYNQDNDFMKNALFLLSKHTHCNNSLITTLHHICGCNDIFLKPLVSKEMKSEFLTLTNFFFKETVTIYNSMSNRPVFFIDRID